MIVARAYPHNPMCDHSGPVLPILDGLPQTAE